MEILKNAFTDITGDDVQNAIHKLVEHCDICQKYGRSSPKPAVALPLSTEFNGCVAMDLHELTNLGPSMWYFHVIDVFSRFSAAGIVKTKKKEPIFGCFAKIWLAVFGPPAMILFDTEESS